MRRTARMLGRRVMDAQGHQPPRSPGAGSPLPVLQAFRPSLLSPLSALLACRMRREDYKQIHHSELWQHSLSQVPQQAALAHRPQAAGVRASLQRGAQANRQRGEQQRQKRKARGGAARQSRLRIPSGVAQRVCDAPRHPGNAQARRRLHSSITNSGATEVGSQASVAVPAGGERHASHWCARWPRSARMLLPQPPPLPDAAPHLWVD